LAETRKSWVLSRTHGTLRILVGLVLVVSIYLGFENALFTVEYKYLTCIGQGYSQHIEAGLGDTVRRKMTI
jgi:hypothetical protein